MKYIGTPDFTHGTEEKLGVLIVNLGTPQAPETRAVRKRWLWNIILHGIILRVRPSKSAKAYREVWSDETGSPLLSISQAQTAALKESLQHRFNTQAEVVLGMRYGEPSIDSAITQLEKSNVRRLIVLPMYPQYSGTTTASVFDAVAERMQRTRWIPELRFINQFCDQSAYIQALASTVRESWAKNGRGELLVTSYHGIPKRYLTSGDPYHCLCHKTSRLLAAELGLNSNETLPGEGYKSIDVLCPAFSADCLETIEEISGENKEYFEENGGERFQYIPCLNDRADHVAFLSDLVVRHAQGWPETDPSYDAESQTDLLKISAVEAEKLLGSES